MPAQKGEVVQPEYPDVAFHGPPRTYYSTSHPKRYIAIHNTDNDASDQDEATYAKRRPDKVSSHYYVDANSITQSLRTEFGASHAGSRTGNWHAIAYEIAGTNGKKRAWWLANVAWSILVRQIARDCRVHDITPQLLTIDQMHDGTTTGIVTHDMMRRAWGGTTHTDPGPGFPIDHLIALVAAELEYDMPLTPEDRVAIWTHDLADGPGIDPAYKVLIRAAMQATTAAAEAKAAKEAIARLPAPVSAAAVAAALAGDRAFIDALADAVAKRIGGQHG
jgi:hypothetical protein